jgi:hypothetical protein
MIFATEDCRGTYESLLAKGVEFTQEPTERFYGTDCALRDPFGNPLRFTQPLGRRADVGEAGADRPHGFIEYGARTTAKAFVRTAPAVPPRTAGPPEAPSTVLPSRSCQELPPTRAYPPCRARMLGHPIPLRPAAR